MLNLLRSIDHNIFYWLNNHLIGQANWLDAILKFLAVYLTYAVPLGLVFVWFFFRSEKNHKTMLAAFFSGVVAWQVVARIIGLFHFRLRPFSDLAGVKELVFHVPTYSFPSDHASFLAALTTYFYLVGLSAEASAKAGYKKIGNLMLIITLLVSFTRVVTGLHWPADIIAGWIVGILTALLFWRLRQPIDKWIISPLMWIPKKLNLA